jgi:hypothetical protein
VCSKRLSHPNVVQTLEHALKTVGKVREPWWKLWWHAMPGTAIRTSAALMSLPIEHALRVLYASVVQGASTDDESEEEREDLDAGSELAGVVERQTWILQEVR